MYVSLRQRLLHCRTASFRWLEKAAVETKPGQTDKWLVTLTEVEEVKCVARLLPIFATLIVYNAVTGQVKFHVKHCHHLLNKKWLSIGGLVVSLGFAIGSPNWHHAGLGLLIRFSALLKHEC